VSAPERASAELLADAGEAAAGEEFFRSREFLDAEGVTHTLHVRHPGGDLLAPLIVREVPGERLADAASPYGYPGFAGAAPVPALDPAALNLSSIGLVSVFIRHRLAEPPLAAATERNIVQVADPGLPPKSRMSDRQQIRRNLRRGYAVAVTDGPRSTPAQRSGFLEAYEETMRRAGASEHYFFGHAYFDRVLASRHSWLVTALEPGGALAAASVAVRSDGMLHYFLSGTADSHLRDSPMKNVVAALCELASDLGLPLNLGGGLAPGDRLEEFKRGFANREQPWHTSELVCDQAAYERLSAGRVGSGFFPAYRSP
jgi:Acetyltransferase (GNAT) domain